MLHGAGPVMGGVVTFGAPAPEAEGPTVDSGPEAARHHTAYRSGMSDWCGNCHGPYHEAGSGSAFKHPVDRALGAQVSQRYDEYEGDAHPTAGVEARAYLPRSRSRTGRARRARRRSRSREPGHVPQLPPGPRQLVPGGGAVGLRGRPPRGRRPGVGLLPDPEPLRRPDAGAAVQQVPRDPDGPGGGGADRASGVVPTADPVILRGPLVAWPTVRAAGVIPPYICTRPS